MIKMIKWKNGAVFISIILLSAVNGYAQTVWFSILSTETEIGKAVEKATSLSQTQKAPELELASCDDCANLRPGLILVTTGAQKSKAEAKADMEKWRNRGIKDAYVRSCDVLTNSRMALGIPLLDPSIFHKSEDVINWDYADAVSTVKPLANGWVAVIQPKYKPEENDTLEGLNINAGVIKPNDDKSVTLLTESCINPVYTANAGNRDLVALTCVTEIAADNLLHKTTVYRIPGKKIVLEQDRCTDPSLKRQTFTCQKQSVDAEGQLHLKPAKFELPK